MEKNTEPQESKVKIEMYKRKNKTYVVKHGDPKRLKTTKLKHHDQTNKKRKKKKPKKPQKARTNNRMNQNIIKLIVIIMLPWGLCSKCPCTCHEPQPTSASLRGPPLPLGWSLDLLWALWGPLRL